MTHLRKPAHLKNDLRIIILSIVCGILISATGIVPLFFHDMPLIGVVGSFIAGVFFTSAFTITPAGVFLAEIMKHTPALEVALIGSAGAVVGDLVIFYFIRDKISEDLNYLLKVGRPHRYKHLARMRFFRFITPLVGALIIASPLPDELGIALMGISKVRSSVLVPLTFGMNFLGITLLAYAIGAL